MAERAVAPRVRFAPSPTGYLHVGGARTALYNWLFARRNNGTFVLRIEDTDRERSDESWTEGILSGLGWLGINWDEGPFFQSERGSLYNEAARRLFEEGYAYACDCTRELVESRTKDRVTPGYDGFCRDRGLEPGVGRALRFKVPDDGVTVVHDIVRGDVEFTNDSIEDFVVLKSNGDPLFVLAVVVDDMDMRITHVIRGEEHLSTTPKALLIWEALKGGPPTAFAHLPVLVNEKRQKLSKRRDRVGVADYAALGYLPSAMRNFLALLGWGPGDNTELFSAQELVERFDLKDVSHSPAFFDEKRLAHFNGLYIRALRVDQFIEVAGPFLERADNLWPRENFDPEVFARVAALVQERVTILSEVPTYVEFLFCDPLVVDEQSFEKAIARDDDAATILSRAAEEMMTVAWDPPSIRAVVEQIGDELGRKLAKTQASLRVATMGRSVGLPLFESLEVLGRERTVARLLAARARAL